MRHHLNVKIHIFMCLHFLVLVEVCVCVCVRARARVRVHTPVLLVRSVPVYSSHLYVCMYGTNVCACLCMVHFTKLCYCVTCLCPRLNGRACRACGAQSTVNVR